MMAPEELSAFLDVAAVVAGIDVPDACRPGTLRNLDLFLRHAAIVAGADDDTSAEPAEFIQP